MDASNLIQLIVLILLLMLSAFFSSAETALITVNKIRMRTLSESGDRRADRVLRVTENSSKMLSAILIGNNLVNISASSLATALAIRLFGSVGAGIATGVLTLLILIFGEISPKTVATLYADSMALRIAGIIEILMKVLTPVILLINLLAELFIRLLGIDPHKSADSITEEELRTIVDVSNEDGVIEDEERTMIHNLFDFGDAKAKEVMVPRIDMTFVRENDSYDEILEVFRQDQFTRLPVCEEASDKVLGIINVKDFLFYEKPDDFQIRDLMREPFFTFEGKNTADLFLEMKESSIPMAIVLDEYGSTAGIITLEDLLEEIVGEIRDEYDSDEVDDIRKLSDRDYLILGSANLEDVSRELNLDFHSEDYDTMGGYCLELMGHLPKRNEVFTTENNILLRIDSMDKNRIERIYMRLPADHAVQ